MVTLAELTYHLGLSDSDQWVTASYAGTTGPWSDEEARALVTDWDVTHAPTTGTEPHNATYGHPCTECGHGTRDYVPGCTCCPL